MKELPPDLQIQPANLFDLSAVRQLEKVCFPVDAWPLLDMIGALTFPNIVRYKALWDGELIGFIAGVSAPVGRRMGHAGAIISGESDTAEAKMNRMEELGVHVVRNPAEIGETVDKVLTC